MNLLHCSCDSAIKKAISCNFLQHPAVYRNYQLPQRFRTKRNRHFHHHKDPTMEEANLNHFAAKHPMGPNPYVGPHAPVCGMGGGMVMFPIDRQMPGKFCPGKGPLLPNAPPPMMSPGGGCGGGPVTFFHRGGIMKPGPHGVECTSAERREGEFKLPIMNAESSKAAFSVIDSKSATCILICGFLYLQSYSGTTQAQMC